MIDFFVCVSHPKCSYETFKNDTLLPLDVDLTGGHFPPGIVFPYLTVRPGVPSLSSYLTCWAKGKRKKKSQGPGRI